MERKKSPMEKKVKSKILIIGGTGFIGYHLAKKCLTLGWKVTSFSIKKPKSLRKLKKVKYLTGNLNSKSSLKKINKEFDYVVNLGGYVDHKNKLGNYNTHFLGCKNLVKIFSDKKIKLFLQIGSGAEYENIKSPHKEHFHCNPKSIYGRPKYLATNYLIKEFKKNNFPCTVVRLYQVYGKGQDTNRIIPFIINSCLTDKIFPCSEGKQLRDFIDIDQVINAMEKILKSKKVLGEIINIGSGKPIKVRSVIERINSLVKKGKPEFGKIAMRKEEFKKFYPDVNKAKKLLGWKPKKNFIKSLSSTISFEKKLLRKKNKLHENKKNFNNGFTWIR